jgi:hypothetical protein
MTREMNDHCQVILSGGPAVCARFSGDQIHRSARVEAAGKSRPGVDAVPLVVESAGTATGIDVRFEHGNPQPSPGEDRRGGQTTDARADHDHAARLCHW